MKVLKKTGIIILITFSSIILLRYILTMQRDTSIITKNIEISKGITIPITRKNSQKKYYGHAHGLSFGGGDFKSSIKFKYKDISYFHETTFITIVTRFYANSFYIIYYDRETKPKQPSYRFFKSNKEHKFEEIEAVDFPKHLAIQNWFWRSKNQPEDLIGLKPEKLKNSTTAYLWYLIEGKPKKYSWDTRTEFIKEYKEKYLNQY